MLGVRDYVDKHRFAGVVIGLSGGVDSALVLAIACDALGASRVQAVMMPSRFTSAMSESDAEAMARGLGVRYSMIPIEGMYQATLAALEREFRGRAPDATEENIQARCRGMLLMAISNKTGRMVLTTGNKSEMAVGYATLYGDMAGGFAPIKDCSKTLVWRLARWRNARAPAPSSRSGSSSGRRRRNCARTSSTATACRPTRCSTRSSRPSSRTTARWTRSSRMGFERATVTRVLELVKRNEYKRRQAPPGVRVSGRAFGRDWRYPITSGYRPGSRRGTVPFVLRAGKGDSPRQSSRHHFFSCFSELAAG